MANEENNDQQVEETPEAEVAPVETEKVEAEPEAAAEAEAPKAEAPVADEEPAEKLSPSEARKRKRSVRKNYQRPAKTNEERAAERVVVRAKKAKARTATRLKAREAHKAAGPREGTPKPERIAGVQRTREGTVVSDKGDKTITVQIENIESHRVYGKVIRTSSKLYAHDETNQAHNGDRVRVAECRPMSRSKRWRLLEVMERSK